MSSFKIAAIFAIVESLRLITRNYQLSTLSFSAFADHHKPLTMHESSRWGVEALAAASAYWANFGACHKHRYNSNLVPR